MKEYNQNNDIMQLINAFQDVVLFTPDTPTLKPSTDNFIEYDGTNFSLDGGRKDSLTSNDSQFLQEAVSPGVIKREKRIKKTKRSIRKGSSFHVSNL